MIAATSTVSSSVFASLKFFGNIVQTPQFEFLFVSVTILRTFYITAISHNTVIKVKYFPRFRYTVVIVELQYIYKLWTLFHNNQRLKANTEYLIHRNPITLDCEYLSVSNMEEGTSGIKKKVYLSRFLFG